MQGAGELVARIAEPDHQQVGGSAPPFGSGEDSAQGLALVAGRFVGRRGGRGRRGALFSLFAGFELYRRWEHRKTRSPQQMAYYSVAPRNRLLVGAVYIGLIVLLAAGMEHSYVLSSGGHVFGHPHF